MPFNKGDFTQQGVAGHVNANLRLNEKRLVNIDLTSNEEAEGCTIAGTVTDLLNDKVYPIGSAPSGNIEITENTAEGESLDISQYATATVNVAGGGGELIGCNVTIINDDDEPKEATVGPCYHTDLFNAVTVELEPNETYTNLLFLYQGDYEITHLNSNVPIGEITSGSFTNLVNCTLDYEEDDRVYWTIVPIDITKPSSVTISIKAFGIA